LSEKKTILVTGANGQLGNEMQVISSACDQYNFQFVTREELPIDQPEQLENFFSSHNIDHLCELCRLYSRRQGQRLRPKKHG
jgi:dTDP-4-dehydrorhamnose reductase